MAKAIETHQAQYRATLTLASMAISLAWHASPLLLLALLIPMLLQALLPGLTLVSTRAVLDWAAFERGMLPALDPLTAQASILTWIGLAAMALALSEVLHPISRGLQSLAGDQLSVLLGERMIRSVNRLPGLVRLEDPAFATDLQHTRGSAQQAGLELVLYFTDAALTMATTLALLLLIATLNPVLLVLMICTSLPSMRSAYAYAHRTGRHVYVMTPRSRELEYSRDVTLAPEFAKDVRLYHLVPFFRERYDKLFAETVGTLQSLRWREAGKVTLAALLGVAGVGASIAWLFWLVAHGQRTPGELVLYSGAMLMLHQQLYGLGLQAGMLPLFFGQYLPALQRVLDAEPDLILAEQPQPIPATFQHGIVFEQVGFTYPSQSQPALVDVSFQIAPGECLALVGQNGAGKTTIVKLLLRLYDPTAGRILLDGIDLRAYDLAALRQHMGVIFQDFARYELTAGETIGLGCVEALHDHTRIHAAAARSGADTLLAQLPNGLDTVLGRELGGRELSGGEWQKLALARAFMRDTALLVLDEPVAALDVETEEAVYTRFHQLTQDRMTLLISHRFATVRMADRIVLLEHGRIAEQGAHATLLAMGGSYARLYNLQAARYQQEERSDAA